MHFEEAVQYLLGLGHETLTIKLGLRNTELLLQALNNPERAFRAVQIAGTNGKGSTAALLDSICRSAGIKAGLYTSPHLTSITERIKFDGVQLGNEDFARGVTTVRAAAEQLLATKKIEALPTFFEQLTCVALLAFRDAGVELAILETGLGGRLDSTTAARAGVAVITQIDIDHEEYLGTEIEQIAAEKAAIIRPGIKAIITPQRPGVLAVLLQRCEEAGVEPFLVAGRTRIEDVSSDGQFCVTFETALDRYQNIRIGLLGQHQIENAALAIRTAEVLRTEGFKIPNEAIVTGVEAARHPGRLELFHHAPLFLLDGAHNPAGARALRSYLESFAPRPLTIVFGAMREKRLDQIAESLFPLADLLILTPIQNPRAAATDALENIARLFNPGELVVSGSSSDALDIAIARTPFEGTICITGSLYLLGEVRPLVAKLASPKAAAFCN